jgi:hypothetical protein
MFKRLKKLEKENSELKKSVQGLEKKYRVLEFSINNPAKYKVGNTVCGFVIISEEIKENFYFRLTNPVEIERVYTVFSNKKTKTYTENEFTELLIKNDPNKNENKVEIK